MESWNLGDSGKLRLYKWKAVQVTSVEEPCCLRLTAIQSTEGKKAKA